MIKVGFDPTQLQGDDRLWWDDWQARAGAATTKVIAAFEDWLVAGRPADFQVEFRAEIWRDLKNWLMRKVFYRRCAYCERLISGAHGDAEHYRPKGAVSDLDESTNRLMKPRCVFANPIDGSSVEMNHPGYFWLAYDWRNLIPACEFCNSGQGKNERFDVKTKRHYLMMKHADLPVASLATDPPVVSTKWPDRCYPSPPILDALEEPLLLNPLNPPADRDPRKHLCFGVRGMVAAIRRSEVGLRNIEVFRLKDEDLRQDRQAAQERFRSDYYLALRELEPGADTSITSKAQSLLNDYGSGKHPFAAAVLDYHKLLRRAEPEPI